MVSLQQSAAPPGGTGTVDGASNTLSVPSTINDVKFAERLYQRAGRAVAAYEYCDESGALSYAIIRFEPKSFRPVHYAGGHWRTGRGDRTRLPYRLPESLGTMARGEVICIAEGEKNAGVLVGLGFNATCNDGGAGKWTDSHSAYFAGAHTVLFEDNDDAGRAHVKNTAASLHKAGASSIRIVSFADQVDKFDIADQVDAGATRADIQALIDTAPVWTPPVKAPARAPIDYGTDSNPNELKEIERRVRLEIAAALAERGGEPRKAGYYKCPYEHRTPKDFLFDTTVGAPIGGCMGKHNGKSKAWKSIAADLGIDVSAIAREVGKERGKQKRRGRAAKARRQADQGGASAKDTTPDQADDAKREAKRKAWLIGEVERRAGVPKGTRVIEHDGPTVTDWHIDLSAARVHIVRAGMGKGKTFWVGNVSKQVLAAGGNVTAFADRRSLIDDMTDAYGLSDYRDFIEDKKLRGFIQGVRGVAICINSGWRLRHDDLSVDADDLLCLEESESLASTLAPAPRPGEARAKSTMNASEQTTAIDVMRAKARAAKRIVLLDAHAGEKTDALLKALGVESSEVIWHMASEKTPRGAIQKVSDEALLPKTVMKKNGACLVVCDTVAGAHRLHVLLPDSVVFTAQDTPDESVKDVLARGGIAVCSPVLQTGMDVQTPCHVFGLFTGSTNEVDQQLQQLGRARHPLSISVCYTARAGAYERGDYRTSWQKASMAKAHRQAMRTALAMPDGGAHPAQIGHQELLNTNASIRALHSRNFELAFDTLARLAGYEIMGTDTAPSADDIAMLKDAREIVKGIEFTAIENAEPVSETDWQQAKQAGKDTKELKPGYTRWQIETLGGEAINWGLIEQARKENWLAGSRVLAMMIDTHENRLNRDISDWYGPDDAPAPAAIAALRLQGAQHDLLHQVLALVFDDPNPESAVSWQWTKADLSQFWDFVQQKADLWRRLFGLRSRQFKLSQDASGPHSVLKSLLGRMGFIVKRRKVRKEERFVNVFYVENAPAAIARAKVRMGIVPLLASQDVYTKAKSGTKNISIAAQRENLPIGV